MKNFLSILITFLIFCCFIQCNNGTSDIAPEVKFPVENYEKKLKEISTFPIGAAMSFSTFSNSSSLNIVKEEFNSITCENAMKIAATQPTANGFDFSQADSIVAFSLRQGKRIHGHTLIWGNSLPSWVTNFKGDSLAWENLMKTRIQTMVTHFKGKVKSWDVVNEAFNDDGSLRRFALNSSQKDNLWCQKLGFDFIARCFQYAHEADPDVMLFYNDYGQEYSSKKNSAIIAMVSEFKRRGIPIHGIGIQMHTNLERPDLDIKNAIQIMASTGLIIHISELDISINKSQTLSQPTDNLLEQQKQKYKSIAEYFKLVPSSQRYGITMWGITDATTWISNDWPLLWDKNYGKKPAYSGFSEGLK
ncbi:MAG: endo-1,4-beta-xylanase [Bacteroidetes bacterium]|nr:endo-1,4-beta-xylanase [Bacteroidota bacterium]